MGTIFIDTVVSFFGVFIAQILKLIYSTVTQKHYTNFARRIAIILNAAISFNIDFFYFCMPFFFAPSIIIQHDVSILPTFMQHQNQSFSLDLNKIPFLHLFLSSIVIFFFLLSSITKLK